MISPVKKRNKMETSPSISTSSAVLISLISMLFYVNTLNHQFVYDDRPAILDNALVTDSSSSLADLLTHDYWGVSLSHSGSHKSYRPVTSLSFKLNWLLTGSSPFYFHLTNVLLHGVVTMLVTRLVSLLPGTTQHMAMLTGVIWSVLPVHSEAVAGVVGRADILATLFSLLALTHHWQHGWSLVTPTLATVAMLSKEQGITVLGVCFVLDLLDTRRQIEARKKSLVRIFLSLVTILSLRVVFLGGELPSFSKADNPASHSDSQLTRLLTFLYLPVFNFQLLLCPSTLSYDWSMSAIPLVTSVLDSRNILSLVFYSLLACLSSKVMFQLYQLYSPTFKFLPRPHLSSPSLWSVAAKNGLVGAEAGTSQIEAISIMALALSLIILPFLPAANIFFYVGFVVAERLLYLPSVGYSLLLAHGAFKTISNYRHYRTLTSLTLAIMIISGGMKTLTRNKDWSNEETLFKSGLTANPPKSFSNLGNILYAQGRHQEAEAAFKEALKHRPNMADTHYNLGILLQNSGRKSEAVQAYQAAIAYRPKLALAYLNLGVTLTELGRKNDAIKILQDCSKLDDNGLKDPKANANARLSAIFHLGKLLVESGEPGRAISILQTAVNLGGQENIFNLLGEAHQALGQVELAERWYGDAILKNPHHVPAQLMMAKMLAKNESRDQEAEGWFKRAKSLAPSEPNVYVHYGLYLMDKERYGEAADVLGHAAHLTPGHYDNVFNAAVAYRQAGQLDTAEEFYRETVKIRPMEAGSHLNLGALLHLRGKLVEAESFYLKAWSLQPGDSNTKINIQRLHNIMRKKNMTISVPENF